MKLADYITEDLFTELRRRKVDFILHRCDQYELATLPGVTFCRKAGAQVVGEMRQEMADLKNRVTLAEAEAAGIGGMLLEVQQNCVQVARERDVLGELAAAREIEIARLREICDLYAKQRDAAEARRAEALDDVRKVSELHDEARDLLTAALNGANRYAEEAARLETERDEALKRVAMLERAAVLPPVSVDLIAEKNRDLAAMTRDRDEARHKLDTLAEQYKALEAENEERRRQLAAVKTDTDNVWRWEPGGDNKPESLACPVVMTADTLLEIRKEAFARGEHDGINGACVAEIRNITNAAGLEKVAFLDDAVRVLVGQRDKLAAFKKYVHDRLDQADVPTDPEPAENAKHGCRIDGRLNYVLKNWAARDAEYLQSARTWKDGTTKHDYRVAMALSYVEEAERLEWTEHLAKWAGYHTPDGQSPKQAITGAIALVAEKARREALEEAAAWADAAEANGGLISAAVIRTRATTPPTATGGRHE